MLPNPSHPRRAWFTLFSAFIVFQLALIGFGAIIATGGKPLHPDTIKRLEAMAQIFQTVCALSVIGCIAITRSRLNANVVRTYQDLMRETMICLAIGELALIFGLVGLAKLHLTEFLIAGLMVFIADFGFVLPAALRLLPATDPDA